MAAMSESLGDLDACRVCDTFDRVQANERQVVSLTNATSAKC